MFIYGILFHDNTPLTPLKRGKASLILINGNDLRVRVLHLSVPLLRGVRGVFFKYIAFNTQ